MLPIRVDLNLGNPNAYLVHQKDKKEVRRTRGKGGVAIPLELGLNSYGSGYQPWVRPSDDEELTDTELLLTCGMFGMHILNDIPFGFDILDFTRDSLTAAKVLVKLGIMTCDREPYYFDFTPLREYPALHVGADVISRSDWETKRPGERYPKPKGMPTVWRFVPVSQVVLLSEEEVENVERFFAALGREYGMQNIPESSALGISEVIFDVSKLPQLLSSS